MESHLRNISFRKIVAFKSNKVEIKLLLDDERMPIHNMILVKTYREFTYFIEVFGMPDFISFDSDLNHKESGYDCAKFLIFYCLERKFPLPEFTVHNIQTKGVMSISKLFENYVNRNF